MQWVIEVFTIDQSTSTLKLCAIGGGGGSFALSWGFVNVGLAFVLLEMNDVMLVTVSLTSVMILCSAVFKENVFCQFPLCSSSSP